MDQIKKFFGLVCVLAIAVSCQPGNGKFARQFVVVDSLVTVVDGFDKRLAAMNPDTINAKLQVVNDRFDFLGKNYPDTTDRKFWVSDMTYLGQVKKAYTRFGENSPTLSRQIEESHKQLVTLRNSLEDDKFDLEEANEYLADEAGVVTQIFFDANKMMDRVDKANVVWDSLRPHFDSITIYYRSAQ